MSGGSSATLHFAVTPAVLQSLEIISSRGEVPSGLQSQLTALGHFSDGSTLDVSADATWSSSDPTIASIDTNGLVSAFSPGVANVSVSVNDVRVAKGLSFQFSAVGHYSDSSSRDLTSMGAWSADDATVMSISKGLGEALSEGDTVIRISYGGFDASATVKVTPASLTSVSMSSSSMTLAAGGVGSLIFTGTYSDGTLQDLTLSATWTSDDENVATVSGGDVSGISAGSALVTGSYSGMSDTSAITVQ